MTRLPSRDRRTPAMFSTSSRRRVLSAGAALAAVSLVPRQVLGGPGHEPPSEKLNLAGVGVGGIGYPQLQGCENAGFRIAALCDVDDVYAKRAYNHWPQARRYRDFRELLAAEGDKIDALYCGTPDHTHAIVVLAAVCKKEHVCCVKPLTRTIEECRVVVEAAQRAGVATQVTAAENTSDQACRVCEWIWAGVLGAVREVHVWTDRPMWPQGMLRPEGQDPVPETFDWNLWIGPAPMRPFRDCWPERENHLAVKQTRWDKVKPHVYHPWNFRGWWDFGTGSLGDMGCHHLNTPFRALKLKHPRRIQATSTKQMPETAPLAAMVVYDFGARDDMPPVRVTWYDGGLKPPVPPEMRVSFGQQGVLYVGERGKMLVEKKPQVFPDSLAVQAEAVPKTLPRLPGMWKQWHAACKGGPPAACNFSWAGPLTDFVLLGNIAIRTGRLIEYDAAKARITNDEAANALLSEPYHNGWSLET